LRFISFKDHPVQKLSFDNQQIISYAQQVTSVEGGYLLKGANVSLEFEGHAKRYYRHGWQSWSLTTWQDINFRPPLMKPDLFHSRQTDPVYARYPNPNGSWLGALEFADGNILLLGALSLEAHVAYRQGVLGGWYETGNEDWFVAYGDELEVFTKYAELLKVRFGIERIKKAPRVWCSWYSLYDTVTEKSLSRVLDDLGDLPFDVFQIDDGWEIGPGEWEPNARFPSGMDRMAARIQATGRKAGLWLAPLLVGKSSRLYREHPEWLLRSAEGRPVFAGFEFGEELCALDATHPEAAEWLANLIQKARRWGYDYLKLDFLYAGALPGVRHSAMPREAAYRHALEIIRQAAGDAYLLACGCPILPSLGLCDGMRVGADVAGFWDSKFYSYYLYNQTAPALKNAMRTTVHRLWLESLVRVDPDVAFFGSKNSLTPERKSLMRDLTEICDFKACSDLPEDCAESEREAVKAWLETGRKVRRAGRYTFEIDGRLVDFSPAMSLPPGPTGPDKLVYHLIGFLGNQLWVLKLWHRLLRYQAAKG